MKNDLKSLKNRGFCETDAIIEKWISTKVPKTSVCKVVNNRKDHGVNRIVSFQDRYNTKDRIG